MVSCFPLPGFPLSRFLRPQLDLFSTVVKINNFSHGAQRILTLVFFASEMAWFSWCTGERRSGVARKFFRGRGGGQIQRVFPSPPLRSPSLHSPPLPSPPLSSLFPSLPLSLPSLTLEVGPLKSRYGSGGALWAPPAESEPQPKSNLVHYSLKIWDLVATILIIFIQSLNTLPLPPKNLLGSARIT